MAVGFGPADGVQDTIHANLMNELDRVRSELQGSGSDYCHDCDAEIPVRRKLAMPNAIYCVSCQSDHDGSAHVSYNRRGSKDSQLR